MNLQREIETLKKKIAKEIDALRSKNARMRQKLERSGIITLQTDTEHKDPTYSNLPTIPKAQEVDSFQNAQSWP